MKFCCISCGKSEFTMHRPSGSPFLFLHCGSCGGEAKVEGACIVTESGARLESCGLPDNIAAVGNDPDDPWVWFRTRLKRSQRELVYRAVGVVRRETQSPARVSTALEYMAAEFLAAYGKQG